MPLFSGTRKDTHGPPRRALNNRDYNLVKLTDGNLLQRLVYLDGCRLIYSGHDYYLVHLHREKTARVSPAWVQISNGPEDEGESLIFIGGLSTGI